MVTAASAYVPRRMSRSRYSAIRGVRYHVREWGPTGGPPLVFLHGGKDTSISFQFIVDALEADWRVIAPDWRGHGLTQATPGNYWTSDFLCDLDGLFAEWSLGGGVPLLGHSMGGDIASLYSALRPEAVTHLVMLDALGVPLDRSPARMAAILTDLLDMERRAFKRRAYASVEEMAERLIHANGRLDRARAHYLAAANAQPVDSGRNGGGLGWPHDPHFRRSFPTLHSVEEWGECWRKIAAPVLCILASDPKPHSPTHDPGAVAARSSYFPSVTVIRAPNTSHNVHHEAPELVAQHLESFVLAEQH
jgi:pimeloyl-ACP methyl ester carboxylesterase